MHTIQRIQGRFMQAKEILWLRGWVDLHPHWSRKFPVSVWLYEAPLKDPQRIEHCLDAGDFMRAEQVGLAQRGQQGEEGFRAAHFLAEILEGMRQGVADREAQRAQPECV